MAQTYLLSTDGSLPYGYQNARQLPQQVSALTSSLHQCLRIVARRAGWEDIGQNALPFFEEVFLNYFSSLAKESARWSEHALRANVMVLDVVAAGSYHGMNWGRFQKWLDERSVNQRLPDLLPHPVLQFPAYIRLGDVCPPPDSIPPICPPLPELHTFQHHFDVEPQKPSYYVYRRQLSARRIEAEDALIKFRHGIITKAIEEWSRPPQKTTPKPIDLSVVVLANVPPQYENQFRVLPPMPVHGASLALTQGIGPNKAEEERFYALDAEYLKSAVFQRHFAATHTASEAAFGVEADAASAATDAAAESVHSGQSFPALDIVAVDDIAGPDAIFLENYDINGPAGGGGATTSQPAKPMFASDAATRTEEDHFVKNAMIFKKDMSKKNKKRSSSNDNSTTEGGTSAATAGADADDVDGSGVKSSKRRVRSQSPRKRGRDDEDSPSKSSNANRRRGPARPEASEIEPLNLNAAMDEDEFQDVVGE